MRTGGNGSMAMGPFAVESRLQRVKNYTLTREEAFKIHMDFTQWSVNARLVKIFIDKSASTLDWLESMGVEFSDIASHGPGMNYTWHLIKGPIDTKRPRNTGYVMTDILTKRAQELGVQIFMKTPVKKILKEEGRVVGVIAEDKDGETIQADAKAVIIATGGLGGYWRAPFGMPLVGDGIRMAREVGAEATEGTMPTRSNAPRGRGGKATMSIFMQPNLMVNLLGERFMDEEVNVITPLGVNAIGRQKDQRAFMILDEDAKRYYVETGFDFVHGFGILLSGDPITKAVGLDDELKQVIEQGSDTVFVADSIEELAGKTGINLDGLKKTINEYNKACETGRDESFNKKPRYLRPVKQPKFYASSRQLMFGPGSPEGIKINHRAEVLTKDFEVIPGLYAAGIDAACNIWRDVYVNVLPGNALGWALNSGRLAAKNALEYIKSIAK
jgi:fumarate reductase flavoprotein subunit